MDKQTQLCYVLNQFIYGEKAMHVMLQEMEKENTG